MTEVSEKILGSLMDHKNTLKSIADLIVYNPNFEKIDNNLINVFLYIKKDTSYFNKSKLTGDKDKAFQNLNNAWYNEAAFNDRTLSPTDPFTKFLPWKIIQFYYSIFTGLSSIVRCHNNNIINNHNKMINEFTTLCLCNKKLSYNLFLSPYCFYIDNSHALNPDANSVCSWSYGVTTHIPNLEQQLIKLKSRPSTIYHYFLELRNWANYLDTYIFRKLYGDTIKNDIYFSLYYILSNFMLLNEIYFIWYFGYDEVKKNIEVFISDFDRIFESYTETDKSTASLTSRLNYYESYGDGFIF